MKSAVSNLLLFLIATTMFCCPSAVSGFFQEADDPQSGLSDDQRELIRALEKQRVDAIDEVIGSVIAIYGLDRSGGGSGVIIDPSGIALTNHHVIMGAGVRGWGGLADGELYKWDLIGTDPGGDVAIIQMHGRDDFPFTPLGDSDDVRVGDWALAMGNPFILTEDQKPTVTLGIVSGVKRYQPGAGQNQLVYGNCIQVDSSINPGNSGGPLFSLNAEVIGINGRGSFKERGRVNVGLGYAISSNQIKNFIPDLLATKLVEHGTLDASFSDRGGKVVCSTINKDAPIAEQGLELGDELLEFEGIPIETGNQFTNLICTLPEDWPARLKIRKKDGAELTINVRMFGLPYSKPQAGGEPDLPREGGEEPSEEEKQQKKLQQEMIRLLSAPPGTVRDAKTNRNYAEHVVGMWHAANDLLKTGNENEAENNDAANNDDAENDADNNLAANESEVSVLELTDTMYEGDVEVGSQQMWLASDGRFRVLVKIGEDQSEYRFDGEKFFRTSGEETQELTLTQAKMTLPIVAATGILASTGQQSFDAYGDLQIDGGDKVAGLNAWRMSRMGRDKDPFYFWLRMYNDEGRPAPQLIKACADKNCDRRDGGVLFGQWQTVSQQDNSETVSWLVPFSRSFVVGLEETETVRFETSSAEISGTVDDSVFEPAEEK